MNTTGMFKLKGIILLIAVFFTVSTFAQNKDLIKIEQILQQQANDWNNGDIDAFMTAYWKSDKLQFGGGRGLTFGWQATLDNYKKGYPNKDAMGKLTFTLKSKEKLSRKTAMIVGKWELERATDHPNGHFMLIWKKMKGEWVIVADHTSSVCGE